MDTAQKELELQSPPLDGISAVKFNKKTDNLLLVSSWDASLRLYDVQANMMRGKFDSKASCLDCCFVGFDKGCSGGLDNTLTMHDLSTGASRVIGQHDDAIRCISSASDVGSGMVVTGGWDSTIKIWDTNTINSLIVTIKQPGKVFTLDAAGNSLVVATSERRINIYDLRQMSTPLQTRESPLKHQSRMVRIFPRQHGYALSSIEGRVALEYFDASPESQKKKYAFKCHRQTVEGTTIVYPINSLAFHPFYGTFATGGCDGLVNIWDGENKKRLSTFRKYPTSISSLDFNHDGSLLAIASSYTFEEGEKEHPNDTIIIRTIQDSDAKPKARAK